MADIKYYKRGFGGDTFYMIDTNILINIAKFYFNGRCGNDEVLTKQITEFILKCRKNGILNYDYAILESSYDYGTNEINTDVMNKFMMVIDTLFMYCKDKEVINNIKQIKPFCKERSQGEIKSIFECKLPRMLFNDPIVSINNFYLIYLYFLKIYYLENINMEPMEKVKCLYSYMINDINCFLAHEFILGQMIFVGTYKDKSIAEGIMKFKKISKGKSAIKVIINALIDIMSYRRMTVNVDIGIKENMPINWIFVTQDIELQNYIELNTNFTTVISNDKISDSFSHEFIPEEKYYAEWNEFYTNILNPNAKKRFIEYLTDSKDNVNNNKIIEEIKFYENIVFI